MMQDNETARYARAYVQRYGMCIVPMPPKTKAPVKKDWGTTELLTTVEQADAYFREHPDDNLGVVLGPSRICSFDVDNLDAVQSIFDEFGWDLASLREHSPTIQGSPTGFRCMFSVPDGVSLGYHKLQWPRQDDPSKFFTVFELRSVDNDSQKQDVLPPSIHPVTQKPYVWLVRPNGHFPPPPDFLVKLWQNWQALLPQLQSVCPWRKPDAPRPARRTNPHQGESVIEAFNDSHDLESCLVRYGYKRQGKRYLSPHSSTGLPGVNVFDDNRCYIHHASDPLCSVESNQPVAPFDLFRVYQHGGDITSACRAAAKILGMDTPRAEHPSYTGAPYVTPEQAAEAAPPEFEHQPLDVFAEFVAPELRPDWLPRVIADYAFDQAEMLAVSPGMIALPAIVACAAAIHDGIEVQPKRHETSWRESARLWCAVVGPPSVRKSPSLKRATSRLRKINRELCEENDRVQAAHATNMEEHKKLKRQAERTGEHVPPPPEEPIKRRMIVEDVTVEALSEILKHNPRGVLAIQDELTGWFGSMDAYSGGGKAANKDRAHWLEIYNGGHRMVDRVMRGSVSIPNWSASMVGGIQPDMMRKIASQMGEDGLMQRFMVVVGGNTGAEVDRPENTTAKHEYGQLIDSLYSIAPSDNPVRLTEAAHIVRERVSKFASEASEYTVLPGGFRSHLGKWSGLFARLLLTYHVIECAAERVFPTSRDIQESTALQVEKLMRDYLYWHQYSFYMNVMTAQTDVEHVRWIAGCILANGLTEVRTRMLTQDYRQWRSIPEFHRHSIMQALEDGGWLAPFGPLSKTTRRPSAWKVNPVVHEVYAEQASVQRQVRADRRQIFIKC